VMGVHISITIISPEIWVNHKACTKQLVGVMNAILQRRIPYTTTVQI
jgi:hypothetical protein